MISTITTPLGRLTTHTLEHLTIGATGLASYAFAHLFTNTVVHNRETLLQVLDEHYKHNRPIITISNHASAIDDPLLWGAMLDVKYLINARRMRWILGAKEVCFFNSFTSAYFTYGRVIPCVRGAGIGQEAVSIATDKLLHGGWIHMFPEGRINQTKKLLKLKWGVAHMLLTAYNQNNTIPIVLPFIHHGMDKVMPLAKKEKSYIPKTGEKISVLIGQPIDFTSDIIHLKTDPIIQKKIREEITIKIQQELIQLDEKLTQLE